MVPKLDKFERILTRSYVGRILKCFLVDDYVGTIM